MERRIENLKPWLQGVMDNLLGARLIRESAIAHRNRLVVILLDSAFETACRAFLQYEKRIKLDDSHRRRDVLMKTVKAKLPEVDEDVWKTIEYYYEEIRCDFYHQSASKVLAESALSDYQDVVYFVFDKAFNIKTTELIEIAYKTLRADETSGAPMAPTAHIVWSKISNKTEKVVTAVSLINPKNVDEINSLFKKEGASMRLAGSEFTNIVARNAGSRKFFYFDREAKRWTLSKAGQIKLNGILSGGIDGKTVHDS